MYNLPESLITIVASSTLDMYPRRHVAWSALLVEPHQPLSDHLQHIMYTYCSAILLSRDAVQKTLQRFAV